MRLFTSVLAGSLISGAAGHGQAPDSVRDLAKSPVHQFGVDGSHFVLDVQPFRMISGETHYARIPRAYWRDCLKKARAMGLSTISTDVFWNIHELRPGVYDFDGERDVAAFVRTA